MSATRRIAATVGGLCLVTAAGAWAAVPAAAHDLLPPVAVGDSLTTTHDLARTVPKPGVLGNDLLVEGGTKAILVSGALHGTVSLRDDGAYTYVPAPGYVGADEFRYRASNGELDSLPATVSITVTNARPVARPDSYSTPAGKVLSVPPAGVLTNDSDADGDALSAKLVAPPSHGSVVLASNGAFSYTPHDGFAGNDSFAYRAWDSVQWSDPASVSVAVVAPPTPAPTPAPTRPPTPQPKPSLVASPTPAPSPTPTPTARPTANPTPARSNRPSATNEPSRTPAQSTRPTASPTPVPAAGGSTGSGGGPPAPRVDVQRVRVHVADTLVGNFGVLTGVEWAVPGLAFVAPGILLIIALLAQGFVGTIWIALSRRRLRGIGVRRNVLI
jgi:hypothetical protein